MATSALLTVRKLLPRALITVVIFASVIILSQDFLIFPGFSPAIFRDLHRSAKSIPEGVRASFVSTSDGETLELWAMDAQPEKRRGALLILHGNGDTVETMYETQRWLRELGFSTYSIEYRGYGKSSGWPSEKGILTDAEAGWAEMQSREHETPFGVYGTSVGTGPASYIAAAHQARLLVLIAPYLSIPDVVSGRPGYKYLKDFLWYDFPSKEYITKLQPGACVIIAHGRRDPIIPFSHGESLAEISQAHQKTVPIFNDQGTHWNMVQLEKQRLEQALDACLASSSTSPA